MRKAGICVRQKTPLGWSLGLVGEARFRAFEVKRGAIATELAWLRGTRINPNSVQALRYVVLGGEPIEKSMTLEELLRRPGVAYSSLMQTYDRDPADGRVLMPGGFTANETPVATADLYNPKTGTWSSAGSMSVPRAGHSAIVLNGNRGVLVMGGLNIPPAATASVDIALQTH